MTREEFRIQNSESGIDGSRGRIGRRPARSFTDLVLWRKAHDLVLAVYRGTSKFPATERYGLGSQLRRAAVSIPANIAEGFKKRGQADKARFLNIAQGSLEEARYYLILTRDLAYVDTTAMLHLIEEVSRLLEAYRSKLLPHSES
jgi:four helix bundle protein